MSREVQRNTVWNYQRGVLGGVNKGGLSPHPGNECCLYLGQKDECYHLLSKNVYAVPRDFIGAILTVDLKRIESAYTVRVGFENLGKYTQILTIIKYYAKK